MQPDELISQDPEVAQDEFALGDPVVVDDGPGPLPLDVYPVPAMGGTPCYGVACVEGIPDGSNPRRMWAPGSLTFAPTPFSFKWQPAESDGHGGSMVAGRVDAMWRDGALIRWVGCMDSMGSIGAEAERLIAGEFLRGVSIMADDVDSQDIELIYTPDSVDGETDELDPDGAITAADAVPEAEPTMMVIHAGRVRSLTLLPEPAFVECTVSLGESPFQPPAIAETVEVPELMAPVDVVEPQAVVAASYTITIPDIWPESWFKEPTTLPPFGAIHITPQGRVFGLLGPSRVDHRAFRNAGQRVQIPRGIDYSEFMNKPALVASGDGHVYRIPAGNITFDCGHASPFDSRREDPTWAASHYDNTCSVAARICVGENKYGTWVAGALMHDITPDAVERMMACALSGDWQGGKLNAALLVPVEGFPTAVRASVRVRDDAIVASSVPVQYEFPYDEPDQAILDDGDLDYVFDLIASANGRNPMGLFDELTAVRFNEIAGR